jgi:hypothetical protein
LMAAHIRDAGQRLLDVVSTAPQEAHSDAM